MPVAVVDPGPDGRLGSADDGGTVTAYNLTAASLSASPVNLTTNLPDSNSEYYTWEITATKRQSARLVAAGELHADVEPRGRARDGQRFHAECPDQRRGQSGSVQDVAGETERHDESAAGAFWSSPSSATSPDTPFARTFVQTLNYGNATIKAEPIAANRTPDITLVDVRTEKTFRIKAVRVMGFFDVYNIFNTNAAQTLTTSSGGSWLRPTAITAPRVAPDRRPVGMVASRVKALVDLAVPAITVLVMLAVGLDLAPTDFARVRRQPRVVAAGLVGPLLVLPPLALLLVVVFAPSSDLQAGLLLIAACPIGGISTTYSYLAGASTALSISLTAISSLLAVATIPLLGRVFGAVLGQPLGLTAPLPLIVAQLLLLLALPVSLGMWVRFRRPALAIRGQRYLKAVGFGGLGALLVSIAASDPVLFLKRSPEHRPAGHDVHRGILCHRLAGRPCGGYIATGSVHPGYGVRDEKRGGGCGDRRDARRTRRVRVVRDDLLPHRDSPDVGRDRRLSPLAGREGLRRLDQEGGRTGAALRSMPSFFMRYSSVVGFTPRIRAAP